MNQPLSQRDKVYFHIANGYEETERFGRKMYRNASMPIGAWRPLPDPIDRLFSHVRIFTNTPSLTVIMKRTGLQMSVMSKIRTGVYQLPDVWLVRLSDYSGLTIAELRAIYGASPSVAHYRTYHV